MNRHETEFLGSIIDVELPADFIDTSFRYNACPSFSKTLLDNSRVEIYIQHINPDLRESESGRFVAFNYDADGELNIEKGFCTENWTEMLEFLNRQ